MIKIETGIFKKEDTITDILMEYEVDKPSVGEYLAILDRVKNELLKNSNMDEDTLKDILFGKEEE